MATKPKTFHAAYQPKAPWGLKAPSKRGKVMATTKLLRRKRPTSISAERKEAPRTHKNQSTAVEKDMPMSRT